MPPPLIRLPASIKNGTAIRGNESQPVMAFCEIISSGMLPSPQTRMAIRVAIPMA